MDIERKETDYQISLGESETAENALRSIAVASFELARPVGMGRLHFDGGSTLRPEDTDQFISEYDGRMVLNMDYVQGRQVKTGVNVQSDGTLIFDGYGFERDRGNPTPVFERAQEILDNIDTAAALPTDLTSTEDQFASESLDLRLQGIGYERKTGENDEQLRRRLFLDLFSKDVIMAGEFLFGKYEPEWHPIERLSYIALVDEDQEAGTLTEFALKTLPDISDLFSDDGESINDDEIDPGIDRLKQLRRFLPNQPELVYDYAKFLAERLHPDIVPMGFVMTAHLAIYDLQHGVNGFTGETIDNTLTSLSSQIYENLSSMTSIIAKAAYEEDFANGVEDFIRETQSQ